MITVYVDGDATEALAELESDVVVSNKKDIRVEFIDTAPLSAEVAYDGEKAEISMYMRDGMLSHANIMLYGVAKNGEVDAYEGDEDTIKIAFAVAEGANKILQKKGMLDECAGLDEDMQGVLFELDNDEEITVKIVEGKKRPSLLCTTSFGAPHMMRPYSDEVMAWFVMGNKSFEEIEEAANAGDVDAMEHLALIYLDGDDEIEENPEKAYYWFLKCAESGNEEAMFNVGLFMAKGFGTKRDFAKAAEWMQKAADEGNEIAMVCAEKYRKLADAFEKAKNGDAQAQADLAEGLMELGDALDQAGGGKDYEESIMWAEKAVAQGCPDGYWILALAYHHGRGVDEDIDKAIEIYQKGAAAGNAPCQHNLGCEYMSGMNLKKDYHKGFELFKAAAEQGYGLAMRDLGSCYQFTHGTTANTKTAIEWYEKALEVIDDPGLEQMVRMLKVAGDTDEDFDMSEIDGIFSTLAALDEYECELAEEGLLPDESTDDGQFHRVHLKAEEGDERAIALLKQLDDIDGEGDEYDEEIAELEKDIKNLECK